MFVLIVGGGLTGAQLGLRLLEHGHTVRLVEHRPQVLARIHRELPTEAIYEGNVDHPQVLEQAGIRDAHILAAFTSSDASNLALCYIASTLYNVPRTIAGVNDPRNAWLFDHKFCVDVALDSTEILAHLIEEGMSLGDMMMLSKLRKGEYTLVEQKIRAGAKVTGRSIRDLDLPEDCIIAGIIREGELVIPRGTTVIEIEDEVLIITDPDGEEELADLFAAPNGEE